MKKILIAFSTLLVLAAFTTTNNIQNSTSTENNQGGFVIEADLDGSQEVNGGDPDGSGHVTLVLNQGQGTISYVLTVQDIMPATAAHIHEAPAGTAGGVVFALSAPTNGMSSGTITGVSKEQMKEIRKNPSDYYVNVHNPQYPAGAVRGQLK